MATYRNNGVTAKPLNPAFASGKKLRVANANVSVASAGAGGTNGDVFILSGPHTLADRVARIMAIGGTPALTSAADNDFGFYKKVNGAFVAIDADILLDGVSFVSANTATRDLLTLNAADRVKNIGELLSLGVDEEPAGGVYLAWTVNTASTVNGTVDLDIHIDEATTS